MLLKKCQIILLILISLGGSKISKAQDTLRLSLSEALRMAQTNNLNIRNSQLDLKSAQKKNMGNSGDRIASCGWNGQVPVYTKSCNIACFSL